MSKKDYKCFATHAIWRKATEKENNVQKPTSSPRKVFPREEFSWRNMIQRCINPRAMGYRYYGGRGIAVCERWMDFWNFLEDMGNRPLRTSLDRKDVNGGYDKENCRWATPEEQGNNRRNNHFLELNGVTKTIQEWGLEFGIKPNTLLYRIRRGWTADEALSIEPRSNTRHTSARKRFRKRKIPPSEHEGIYERYLSGISQTQIGAELGIHSSAISRICSLVKTLKERNGHNTDD